MVHIEPLIREESKSHRIKEEDIYFHEIKKYL